MSLTLKSLSATMEKNQADTNAVLAAIMAKLGVDTPAAAPPAPPTAAAENPLAKYLPAVPPAAAPPAPPKQHTEASVVDVGSGKNKTRCISLPILTKLPTGNDFTDRIVMGYHKVKSLLLQMEHLAKYCDYCEKHGEGGAPKV